VGPFDAPLGLWGAGVDGRDVQAFQSAPERGSGVAMSGVFLMDAEHAVAIRVERYRTTPLL